MTTGRINQVTIVVLRIAEKNGEEKTPPLFLKYLIEELNQI